MKTQTSKPATAIFWALALLSLCGLGFAPKAGLDSYEIYLNEKLILKQQVNQPLTLRKLQLVEADRKGELRIRYRHCKSPETGIGRVVSVKDEQGNVLRKWEYADTSVMMTIPVKELLNLERESDGRELALFYTARQHPNGEMLAELNP